MAKGQWSMAKQGPRPEGKMAKGQWPMLRARSFWSLAIDPWPFAPALGHLPRPLAIRPGPWPFAPALGHSPRPSLSRMNLLTGNPMNLLLPIPGIFTLVSGLPADYRQLHAFHYLPKCPRTFAGVWVVRYQPVDAEARLIGVAVLSWPFARCAPRERHFGLQKLRMRDKLEFANRHLRTISRVVVHPQFRSLGLAVRLIKCLCDNCTTRFVEASARMAEFHPMFALAGMKRIALDDPTLPAYYLLDRQEHAQRPRDPIGTSSGPPLDPLFPKP